MGRFFLFLKFAFFLSLFFILFFFPKKALASEDNLLENPGFEELLYGWEASPGLEIAFNFSTSSYTKRSGEYSALIKHSKTGSYGAKQVVRAIVGGKDYLAKGYVFCNDDNAKKAMVRIAWYSSTDGSGSQIKTVDSNVISTASPLWQELNTEVIKAPADAQSAEFRILLASSEGAESLVYFDDLFFALAPSITPTPSPSPSPTPTPTIDPTPTPYTGGGISLNEFMPNPSEGEEWVEIKNGNDFEVDLKDWFIDDIADGGSKPVKFSTTLSPGGYAVIEVGKYYFNNSGDTVRLLGQGGEEIETYPYASSRKGYSFAKDADGNWQETSDPTPGEENSIVGFSTPQPEAGRPLDGTPTPVPTATPTLEPDSVLGLSSKPSTSSANTATDSGYLVDLMCPLIEELETKFQIQKNDNLGQNAGGEEKKDINETRPHVRYVLLLGLAAAVGSFGSLLKETSFLVKWWHELFSKV